MSDKGEMKFGLGHQFKAKARDYKAISNDLRDVMREHGLSNEDIRPFYAKIGGILENLIEDLEDAAGRELDSFNDRS